MRIQNLIWPRALAHRHQGLGPCHACLRVWPLCLHAFHSAGYAVVGTRRRMGGCAHQGSLVLVQYQRRATMTSRQMGGCAHQGSGTQLCWGGRYPPRAHPWRGASKGGLASAQWMMTASGPCLCLPRPCYHSSGDCQAIFGARCSPISKLAVTAFSNTCAISLSILCGLAQAHVCHDHVKACKSLG